MERWLLVLMLMASGMACAEEVTLTWTNPVQNTDGTPLTDLEGIRIWHEVANITDTTQTSATIVDLLPGDHNFIATAYNTAGVESKISNEATKTVEGLIATAESTVYQVVTISNGVWLLPIAIVPVDTGCIIEQAVTVNGVSYHAVPRDQVEWSAGATARPQLVVADCR